MAINFGIDNQPANTQANPQGDKPNILNLQKKQILNLSKKSVLRNLSLVLKWDSKDDLDASAFLLHSDGKVHDANKEVVYYHSQIQKGIRSLGDQRTGKGSSGDGEVIELSIPELDPSICGIVFFITIFDENNSQKVFGQIGNASATLYNRDENDKVMCACQLTSDYSTDTAITVCRLFKDDNGDWNFEAIKEGCRMDLNDLLYHYM